MESELEMQLCANRRISVAAGLRRPKSSKLSNFLRCIDPLGFLDATTLNELDQFAVRLHPQKSITSINCNDPPYAALMLHSFTLSLRELAFRFQSLARLRVFVPAPRHGRCCR